MLDYKKYSYSKPYNKLLIAVAITIGLTKTTLGFELPNIVNPNPTVQNGYMENSAQIMALFKIATNEKAKLQERRNALNILFDDYLDYAISASAKILKRENDLLSDYVVTSLSSLMRTHVHSEVRNDNLTPYERYLEKRYDYIVELLTEVISHHQDQTLREAASILAAIGHRPALDAIIEANASERLSDIDTIDILSLAPQEMSGPYLERFMESNDLDTRKQALFYLAYNKQYVERIREIALNPETSDEIVTAVRKGLSVTDKEFANYE